MSIHGGYLFPFLPLGLIFIFDSLLQSKLARVKEEPDENCIIDVRATVDTLELFFIEN